MCENLKIVSTIDVPDLESVPLKLTETEIFHTDDLKFAYFACVLSIAILYLLATNTLSCDSK